MLRSAPIRGSEQRGASASALDFEALAQCAVAAASDAMARPLDEDMPDVVEEAGPGGAVPGPAPDTGGDGGDTLPTGPSGGVTGGSGDTLPTATGYVRGAVQRIEATGSLPTAAATPPPVRKAGFKPPPPKPRAKSPAGTPASPPAKARGSIAASLPVASVLPQGEQSQVPALPEDFAQRRAALQAKPLVVAPLLSPPPMTVAASGDTLPTGVSTAVGGGLTWGQYVARQAAAEAAGRRHVERYGKAATTVSVFPTEGQIVEDLPPPPPPPGPPPPLLTPAPAPAPMLPVQPCPYRDIRVYGMQQAGAPMPQPQVPSQLYIGTVPQRQWEMGLPQPPPPPPSGDTLPTGPAASAPWTWAPSGDTLPTGSSSSLGGVPVVLTEEVLRQRAQELIQQPTDLPSIRKAAWRHRISVMLSTSLTLLEPDAFAGESVVQPDVQYQVTRLRALWQEHKCGQVARLEYGQLMELCTSDAENLPMPPPPAQGISEPIHLVGDSSCVCCSARKPRSPQVS